MSIIDFELVDIPIEFKKIKPSDFESNFYETSITSICPNIEGYISEDLLPILDKEFNIKNTVVINAGVGQGKSRAIIDKVVDYSKVDDYIVIIAVPFDSLIEQYEDDCLKRDVSSNEIFNIRKINSYNFLNKDGFHDSLINTDTSLISDFKIHIMTINSLLGNPGENYIFQAKIRTDYFHKLFSYCKTTNKKIVIFFDEIHDGIQNFREEYIYKLWDFQDLIFKIFIVSATFNEASKEVIKYLAEFTERKISIIESQRVKTHNKQSKLHIIINDYKAISNNSHLKKLTNSLIDEKKAFDIILYSKKQAKQLLKSNGLLYSIRNEVNLCYRDDFDFSKKSNKKYDKDLINIGTNFTTGVNINKDEHTLIVVLPKRLQNEYINNKGMFSSGVNALIQTLARQRIAGDIYIIMPTPYSIEKDTLPYNNIINDKIIAVLEKYARDEKVKYSNINKQSQTLTDAYSKLEKSFSSASRNINKVNRAGMNTLAYPSKERFILEKGEKHLTKNFFGGDLATYTFFAAITNQFLNCTLNEIFCDNKIIIEEGKLFKTAFEIYKDFAFSTIFENPNDELDEAFHNYYSEYHIIKSILSFIENKEFEIKKGNETIPAQRDIKRAVMYLTIQHGSDDGLEGLQKISSIELGKILSKLYFQSCVKFSNIKLFEIENEIYTKTEFDDNYKLIDDTALKISHYKKWIEYIDLIEVSIKDYRKKRILSKEPSPIFKSKFKKEKMQIELEKMLSLDLVLNAEIIPFKDTFTNTAHNKKVETFYTLLFNTFFIKSSTDTQITVSNTRIRFYKDVKRKNIDSMKINLLYDKIPEAIL